LKAGCGKEWLPWLLSADSLPQECAPSSQKPLAGSGCHGRTKTRSNTKNRPEVAQTCRCVAGGGAHAHEYKDGHVPSCEGSASAHTRTTIFSQPATRKLDSGRMLLCLQGVQKLNRAPHFLKRSTRSSAHSPIKSNVYDVAASTAVVGCDDGADAPGGARPSLPAAEPRLANLQPPRDRPRKRHASSPRDTSAEERRRGADKGTAPRRDGRNEEGEACGNHHEHRNESRGRGSV